MPIIVFPKDHKVTLAEGTYRISGVIDMPNAIRIVPLGYKRSVLKRLLRWLLRLFRRKGRSVVVAAHNSSDEAKAEANYVCDEWEINKAIEELGERSS